MALNRFREIRGQQDKEAGVVQQAVQIANTIESMRRGTGMQAQQSKNNVINSQTQEALAASGGVGRLRTNNNQNLTLASELLAKPGVSTTTNLTGQGFQSTDTHQINAGVSCCFIFLEVLNGSLPECVELGRAQFITPRRRKGYKWMSEWLVPLMQKFAFVKWLMNELLVKPFIAIGEIHYAQEWTNRPIAAFRWMLLRPYCQAWFWLWACLSVFYVEKEPKQ
jgi:hypothetical protein